jgi:replicative DNA helicase
VTTLLEATTRLFRGRGDVYAKAFPKEHAPGKVGYALVKEPLTDAVLHDHLAGKTLVGQYQLLPDSSVYWFALDFDADGEDASVVDQALRQMDAFLNAGLQVYLEQSRSGNGCHVWGFFDSPVPAERVRRALKPLLMDVSSFDRLYPVQTTVSETRPYGNLIALPFFGASATPHWSSPLGPGVPGGASVFLNTDTLEPIGPEAFVQTVRFNNRYVIEELADNAPVERDAPTAASAADYEPVAWGETYEGGRPEKPTNGVLKLISDYGCQFMAHAFMNREKLPEPQWYVAIQQLTCFENGREAAHMISQDYPGYSARETDDKYTQALRHPPVGCRYIKEHFPHLACKGCAGRAPYEVANRSLGALTKETTAPMFRSNYKSSLDRMRRRNRGEMPVGALWGIAGLDQYTRLRPKELTVVGALPSIGKSSLMVDGAVSLAERGVPVLVFSAETGQEGLEERLLARVSGVDSRAIRGERSWGGAPYPMTPDEERMVEDAAGTLSRLPLFTHYSATNPDLIVNLLEDTILRERLNLGAPMVIFFDYLQFGSLDASGGQSEYEKLSWLSMEFKYLAKVLRQPVVIFSQLTREKEENDEPQINWFKGTGRIEADADVAMILTGERTPGAVSKRKISIVKQREGEAGVSVDLLLHQAISKFVPVPGANDASVSKDIFALESNAFVD